MMGYGFGMGVGFIGMLMFWLLIVGLAVWAISLIFPAAKRSGSEDGQASSTAPQTPTADEILKARYARGELSQAQYQEMQQTLKEY
jgi:putative membrane protein